MPRRRTARLRAAGAVEIGDRVAAVDSRHGREPRADFRRGGNASVNRSGRQSLNSLRHGGLLYSPAILAGLVHRISHSPSQDGSAIYLRR